MSWTSVLALVVVLAKVAKAAKVGVAVVEAVGVLWAVTDAAYAATRVVQYWLLYKLQLVQHFSQAA